MNARDVRREAQDALEYMRAHEKDTARCFGYVWATLARLAGTPSLPLPQETPTPASEPTMFTRRQAS